MKIEMISTGDEVLTGFITDTNSTFLSEKLLDIGIQMTRRSTVGDELKDLVEIFLERSNQADVIIVNGGLGPTTDDLSAQAAALAAHKELILYPEWVSQMQQWYDSRHREMPKGNLKQATLPAGCSIINNPIGTACGFSLKINNAVFYFTPGVPSEFKKMVTDEIIPLLKQKINHASNNKSKVLRYFIFGIGESAIGDILKCEDWPQNITVGYRVDSPYIELKLISSDAVHTDFTKAEQILKKAAGKYLIAEQVFDFYEQISAKLKNKMLTIVDNTSLDLDFNNLQKNIPCYQYFAHKCESINKSMATHILSNKVNSNNDILIEIDREITLDDEVISISIKDFSTQKTLFRKLKFLNKGNFKIIGIAFATADILRRYLNDSNPYVEYEYIKDVIK